MISTIPLAINSLNQVVGRFFTSDGALHGFVYLPYDSIFVTYDHLGSSQTSFNGINDLGYIAGRYIDGAGTAHGFVARLVDDH